MTYKLKKEIPLNIFANKNSVYDELTGGYEKVGDFEIGKQSIIVMPDKVEKYLPELRNIYPKDNVTLKVFSQPVKDATQEVQIQNLFAIYGLAPRIYDFISLENFDYRAQIIEYVKDDYCVNLMKLDNITNRIRDFANRNFIDWSGDVRISNVKGNQWLDFGNFKWHNFDAYARDVIARYNYFTEGGYQDCPFLGIKGGRATQRVEKFKLDKYDWDGKTVLDLGCNGGYFVNYCAAKGARVIGIDRLPLVQIAYEVSNFQKLFNAEYYAFDLTRKDDLFLDYLYRLTGLRKFDYVFFLSMHHHVGWKDYLKDIAKTLFFETNGAKPVKEEFDEWNPKLKGIFPKVEFVGTSNEGPERNLFVCRN